MCRRPAVLSIAHVRNDALFARQTDRITHQALLYCVVHLGKPHDDDARALRCGRSYCLFRGGARIHIRTDVRNVLCGRNA
jgi:hypothetical protein